MILTSERRAAPEVEPLSPEEFRSALLSTVGIEDED